MLYSYLPIPAEMGSSNYTNIQSNGPLTKMMPSLYSFQQEALLNRLSCCKSTKNNNVCMAHDESLKIFTDPANAKNEVPFQQKMNTLPTHVLIFVKFLQFNLDIMKRLRNYNEVRLL